MSTENLRFTESHEWARAEGDLVVVGISDHAQNALGDVTFVELPALGAELAPGDEVGAIESCKAAASVYAPVSGKVVAVNESLEEMPEQINSAPYGDGWICKIEASAPAEWEALMDAAKYEEFLKG